MSQATRILLALVAGIALGILGVALNRDAALAVTTVTQPIGEAWLHGLQMVIVPLIVGLLVLNIRGVRESVLTLVPIFFLQLVEIPALFFLGIWFLMQFVNGLGSLAAVSLGQSMPAWAQTQSGSVKDDIAILNVALGLEYQAIAAYQVGAESGLLQKPVLATAVKFQGHHKAHAQVLAGTVSKLGGTPVMEKTVAEYNFPVSQLKTQADVLRFAAGLEKGATSAAAKWLAKRENEADLIGGINIRSKNQHLASVLLDLSTTAQINDSLKLAKSVLGEIGTINRLHKAQVEQAGFAVLKAPDIPSILVETAFISNPEEETRLTDENYQDQMADALTRGIRKYLLKHPSLTRHRLT